MQEKPRGLYRASKLDSPTNWARVEYQGRQEMDVPRSQYISQGYEPDFDELPTEHEYKNARGIA